MLKNFIKNNPKISVAASLFVLASVVAIIAAIILRLNSTNEKLGERSTYIDDITGERIVTVSGLRGGAASDEESVLYAGFPNLISLGVSLEVLNEIKRLSLEYAKTAVDGRVEVISFYNNYYKLLSDPQSTPRIYKIKLAINNDSNNNIYVKLTDRGPQNYDIALYSDDDLENEISRYSYCSVLVCKPDAPNEPRQNTGIGGGGGN